MLMVQREKSIRDYNSNDFVKYFAKKYLVAYDKAYPVIFARDSSIMLKVMRAFFEENRPLKDIFKFIDDMFEEYPKRRRLTSIDLNWVFNMTKIYLRPGVVEKKGNKAKAPEMELDDEMKAWLESEKEKLQKPKD
jgi:hypothetical protein